MTIIRSWYRTVCGSSRSRCRTTEARLSASGSRHRPGAPGAPVGIGYLADSGCWSENMAESLADVDLIGHRIQPRCRVAESIPRPDFLIERNLGDGGHLSNAQGRAARRRF